MFAEALFWTSTFGIIYPYIIFPLILIVISRLINSTTDKKAITPKVSMIIAAYNEENSIAKKLENTLALDYPSAQLEIIIASDGSDDNTIDIVRSYNNTCIKYLDLSRRGKIFALSDAVEACTGQVLVFSDANTMFDTSALKMLVRNFADENVGGVCGNQLHTKDIANDTSTEGEKWYWRYDKWLKSLESQTGSIVSADGAIYAIRKKLFRTPDSASVTDDFAISTYVIEQGYRLVYEPKAIANEPTTGKTKKEFSRKVRIINRGLRGVILRKKLLNPFRYGFYSVIIFSHKISRRIVPIFLILLFASNLFLFNTYTLYLAALIFQAGFYAWATISYLLKNMSIGHKKIFFIPFFFCLANLAALVAIYNLVIGKRVTLWSPQR